MKRLLLILSIMSFIIPLTGCGIKPKSVEAPKGSENIVFPRTYPNPATADQ